MDRSLIVRVSAALTALSAVGKPAFAADKAAWLRPQIALGYAASSGSKYESFSNTMVGFIAEFRTSYSYGPLALVGKSRMGFASGSASLMDGTTARTPSVTTLEAETGIGLRLDLFAFKPQFSVLPYVGGGGTLGFVQANLSANSSYTVLHDSETAFTRGYEAFAGVAYSPSGQGYNGTHFFAEAQLRRSTASLFGNSTFHLDGFQILGGFGW